MELKVDNAAIEKLVHEHIRAAVMGALASKSDFLIGKLVDEALGQKRNSYDRQTILHTMIDDMIRKAATEAANEWLGEQKPKIKKLVHDALGKKSTGLVAMVAEQLVANFGKGMHVNVWIKGEE